MKHFLSILLSNYLSPGDAWKRNSARSVCRSDLWCQLDSESTSRRETLHSALARLPTYVSERKKTLKTDFSTFARVGNWPVKQFFPPRILHSPQESDGRLQPPHGGPDGDTVTGGRRQPTEDCCLLVCCLLGPGGHCRPRLCGQPTQQLFHEQAGLGCDPTFAHAEVAEDVQPRRGRQGVKGGPAQGGKGADGL